MWSGLPESLRFPFDSPIPCPEVCNLQLITGASQLMWPCHCQILPCWRPQELDDKSDYICQ